MKVALIAPYPNGGARHAGFSGVASYTANLAQALAAAGASVTVVAPELGGEPPLSHDGPVRVERRFRRGPKALPSALRSAYRMDVDVVHLQHELFLYGGLSSLPGLTALAWPRPTPRPTVVTMHQVVDPTDVDPAYTDMHRINAPARAARAGISGVQRLVGGAADRVVVHEPAFTGVVPGAVVIPHGVEPAEPQDSMAARAALGMPLDGLLVLCFGFVAPYKGLETACAAAVAAGQDVHLVVAGGEHPRLLAARDGYAGQLRDRYGERVRFTGYVPESDVALWFSAADVALFGYPRPHASSGALALAYAYQTPVLMSEALGDTVGAPASMVVPNGVQPLADVLADVARDPRPLEGNRQLVRRLAAGRTWDVAANRHLAVYANAVPCSQPPCPRPLSPG